jgi:hypothetical protein
MHCTSCAFLLTVKQGGAVAVFLLGQQRLFTLLVDSPWARLSVLYQSSSRLSSSELIPHRPDLQHIMAQCAFCSPAKLSL